MARMSERVSNLERARCTDVRRWCRVIVERGATPVLPADGASVILRTIVDPVSRAGAA